MAALIERVGKIDIATRLKRRSEERPNDAYGALLRAIVGQQLSTKAARTIYLRVIDLFDGSTPSPEQLLEAREEDLREAGPLRAQDRIHPRPRLPRPQRRAGAGPPRRARRRGGDRRDRRRPRPRPVDGGDVPALPSRTAGRPLRRRPRDPQSDPDRVRPGGDADRRRGCWRSASPGGPTAASPRSTSGSPSRRCRDETALLARHRRRHPRRPRLGPRRDSSSTPTTAATSTRCSTTRRCAPPTRWKRSPRLSVDQLTSAAAFFQSRGRPQPARVRGLRQHPAAAGRPRRSRLSSHASRMRKRARLRTPPRVRDPSNGSSLAASARREPAARLLPDHLRHLRQPHRSGDRLRPRPGPRLRAPFLRRAARHRAGAGHAAGQAAPDRRHRDQRLPRRLPGRGPGGDGAERRRAR